MWATAATLVVPGTLAVAVAVTLLSGGLSGLGAAGQVVTGPSIPGSALTGARVRSRSPARLPTVPSASRAVAVTSPRGAATAPGPSPRRAAGSPLAVAPPRHSEKVVSAPAPASSPPAGDSPSQPQARPNPVRDVGEGVAHTIGTAPAPAGPAGQDAVTTVVEIIPPPPAATAPPGGGPPAGGPPAPARPVVPLPLAPLPSVPVPTVPVPPAPAIPALPVH